MRHRRERVNGVELHVAEEGEGPAVVLLHGFPDFWYSWRHQVPALTGAGYRAVLPDLRGYNESSRPAGVAAYAVAQVTQDIAELIERVAPDGAYVVGHDWGGVIAWRVAALHAALVRRVAILNAPHPQLYARELRRPRQMMRSWYVGFFQLPRVPEALLRRGAYAFLRRNFARVMPAADVERYIEALSRPGVLTAALNYYRAAARAFVRGRSVDLPRIDVPTLVLWGERDRALNAHLLEGLEEFVSRLTIVRLPTAGHFVHWHAPDAVNAELISFFGRA